MLYSALEERYVPALMSPPTTHVPSSKYVAREGCGVAVGRGVGVGGVGSATIRLKQRQDPTVPPLSVTFNSRRVPEAFATEFIGTV